MNIAWHTTSVSEAIAGLVSGEHGLSEEEALRRLKEFGPNKLPVAKPEGYFIMFLRQFQSPLIYTLLAASAVVFATGERVDAGIILFVLVFNAVVGVVQEGRAQNTLLALKKFAETSATVLRAGKELIIPDHEVVVGDIIVLQEGAKVPADARITLAHNLKVDQASLTGESMPVSKAAEKLPRENVPIAEQSNMVFKGTNITIGNGQAVVTATGVATALGAVAQEIAAIDTEVPLKANIRNLSHAIMAIVGVTSVLLFFGGVALGHSVQQMFGTVVSLAVSVIPEGLPIVMTLVLAAGVWRMSKRNALVKKLQAVEALGQAKVIAVDKTGTITKNELVIQKVWAGGTLFDISGVGYEPAGDALLDGNIVDAANHPELLFAGKVAALCANAQTMFSEEEGRWRVAGDPTEAAMLVFARKVGFDKDDLEREAPLVSEIPFDYSLKYHATVHRVEGKNLLCVVGAPEAVLDICQKVRRGDQEHPLSQKEREDIERVFAEMSEQGLRVIAFAAHEGATATPQPGALGPLVFFGFLGMKDGLRSEVREAMERAEAAGIRVVMITGDHKLTARAVAREAGIFHDGDEICSGTEIDAMNDAQLAYKLGVISVFARVTPEHKLRIINAYRKRGEVVAMTGDGVNDAPSLVAADLGVAMGRIGTEVAKEAADIVLLDDNFGSIVSAVEEGRSIYKTIKKVILYLFSTGLGEMLAIIGSLTLGFPLIVLPAQIIWLNFVTDGFLDVALAMEPKEKGLLSGTFPRPAKYLIDRLMAGRMALMAVVMMVGTLFLFSLYIGEDLTKALTVSMTTLAVFQWFNAWNCRSETESLFRMNPFANMFLIGATGVVVLLQILAVYTPFLQGLLHTMPLTLSEWLLIIPVAFSIIVAEEIRKFFYRRLLARKALA